MNQANTKARAIIQKARDEFGYTFEQIAEICGVAIGSVQRWYTTGRAKADRIQLLETLITNSRIPEHKIAENLIAMYWNKDMYGKSGMLRLSYQQIRDMSGRERLSDAIVERIQENLDEHGFVLINNTDDQGRRQYVIVRKGWLAKKAREADESFLEQFYAKRFEVEVEEEEEPFA